MACRFSIQAAPAIFLQSASYSSSSLLLFLQGLPYCSGGRRTYSSFYKSLKGHKERLFFEKSKGSALLSRGIFSSFAEEWITIASDKVLLVLREIRFGL